MSRLTSHSRASHLHTSMADIESDVGICSMESRVYLLALMIYTGRHCRKRFQQGVG